MKHFVIKLLVVFAVVMYALPHLYAQQDTTITIYGKRFAPGAKVFLNGTLIDSLKVQHDNAQPSRILRVRIALSILQSPPAIANIKDGGATVQSSRIVHIVRVVNPGLNRGDATDTISITRPPPTIVLKTLDGKVIGSPELPILNIFALMGKDTTITLRLEYSGLDAGSVSRLSAKSSNSPFQILNASGQDIENQDISLSGRSGNLNIRIKFTERAGVLSDSISISLNQLPYRSWRFEGIRRIKILAAYTNNCLKPFFKIKSQSSDTTRENPVSYLQASLDTLNSFIATSGNTADTLSIHYTRFILAGSPLLVSYQEPSILSKNIHTDITALQNMPEIQAKLMMDNSIQSVVLLVNSDEAPYRATASECTTSGLPKFIVAEIKYAHTFIAIGNLAEVREVFFDDLRNAIR
jgi:hypothetical protein